MINLARRLVHEAFGLVGLEVRRKILAPRMSLPGLLIQAKTVGLLPATVIDVGGAYGMFTTTCLQFFPNAYFILVEPLKEYEPFLKATVESCSKAEYILAAATSGVTASIVMNVQPILTGSSMYRETGLSANRGVSRTVPTVSLDVVIRDRDLKGSFMLKLDVQGAELEVLSGADTILQDTEYVLIEVSFFEFFEGAGQFYEVVEFMKSKGFVPYDFYEFDYRPLDSALAQVNVAFVKETGLFRQVHDYTTQSQRDRYLAGMLEKQRKYLDNPREMRLS